MNTDDCFYCTAELKDLRKENVKLTCILNALSRLLGLPEEHGVPMAETIRGIMHDRDMWKSTALKAVKARTNSERAYKDLSEQVVEPLRRTLDLANGQGLAMAEKFNSVDAFQRQTIDNLTAQLRVAKGELAMIQHRQYGADRRRS